MPDHPPARAARHPALAGVRAVLLDMGGVLLDVGNLAGLPQGRLDYRGREALLRELARSGARGLSLERLDELLFGPWQAEYARRYERGSEARWEPHLRRLRHAVHSRAHTLRLLGTWFAPYAETITPMPGARATLAALRAAGLPLALVSNVPLPGTLYAHVLAAHDLLQPLAALCWSYDAGSRKPSPALVRLALGALGVGPEEAVMVGDRRATDVASGRSAGTVTVWLRSEHRNGPEPDLIIDALSELPALLGA